MDWVNLLVLAVVSFIQNMAFTWSSRSRNSGNPRYHFFVALTSNGVWFICQVFIIKNVWKAIMAGDMITVIIAGLIYVLFTSSGSAFMMSLLLKGKAESGKNAVGAK